MRRLLTFVLAAVILVLPMASMSAGNDGKKLPVLLVFVGQVGHDPVAIDQKIADQVVERFVALGNTEVLAYNPDLPSLRLAVARKKLTQEIVDKPSDSGSVAKIVAATGVDYALRIEAAVKDGQATVALEMFRHRDKGHWVKMGAGAVPQGPGAEGSMARKNAVANAISSAFSQITIQAFGQDVADKAGSAMESVAAKERVAQTEKPAEAKPAQPQPETRNIAEEYKKAVALADGCIAGKDLPGAVMALRSAINLDPMNPAPRGKLAAVYVSLGLTPLAIDEYRRAIAVSPNDVGIRTRLAQLLSENGMLDEASSELGAATRLDPKNVQSLLELGDLYWNQSKVDEATKAYESAASLEPANPLPHEKLYKLNLARRMYKPAIEQLILSKEAAGGVSADPASKYKALAEVAQDEFDAVLGKLISSRADFDAGKMPREDFYQECRDFAARSDALSAYLTAQSVPDASRKVYSHAVLAASLLAQASSNMVSFFETEKDHYLEQASILQKEAKTEYDTFAKGSQGAS